MNINFIAPTVGVNHKIDRSINLDDYNRFVVFFSGGKDSIAAVLHLMECGVNPDLIELHHHLVDGREGSDLMDWPVTTSYCTAFAQSFNLKIQFSWKEGGFEREMNRNGSRTAPIMWQDDSGTLVKTGGQGGKLGVRQQFPQVAANLSVRWCSAYLKIDVGARILTTEPRFRHGKTLVITGERAEESSARASYCTFEPNRSDNRNGKRVNRHIDHYRPIHKWSEHDVWEILRRHNVNPHPAYHIGFGRCSCMCCIFGNPNQWATIKKYAPMKFHRIAVYEEDFGKTIHRTRSVKAQAEIGSPYQADPAIVALAMGDHYPQELLRTAPGSWALPMGAFGDATGPV